VWDAGTGVASQILTGNTSSVQAVAWSPDGTRLVSVAQDASVYLWRVPQTSRAVRFLARILPKRLHNRLSSTFSSPLLAISAERGALMSDMSVALDGSQVAIGLDTGCIVRIDLGTESPNPVRSQGLPDGGWVVFYSDTSYRLNGHPGGYFWWSSGLCRFEAHELDNYGLFRAE
jgi:WD40 repeat protein